MQGDHRAGILEGHRVQIDRSLAGEPGHEDASREIDGREGPGRAVVERHERGREEERADLVQAPPLAEELDVPADLGGPGLVERGPGVRPALDGPRRRDGRNHLPDRRLPDAPILLSTELGFDEGTCFRRAHPGLELRLENAGEGDLAADAVPVVRGDHALVRQGRSDRVPDDRGRLGIRGESPRHFLRGIQGVDGGDVAEGDVEAAVEKASGPVDEHLPVRVHRDAQRRRLLGDRRGRTAETRVRGDPRVRELDVFTRPDDDPLQGHLEHLGEDRDGDRGEGLPVVVDEEGVEAHGLVEILDDLREADSRGRLAEAAQGRHDLHGLEEIRFDRGVGGQGVLGRDRERLPTLVGESLLEPRARGADRLVVASHVRVRQAHELGQVDVARLADRVLHLRVEIAEGGVDRADVLGQALRPAQRALDAARREDDVVVLGEEDVVSEGPRVVEIEGPDEGDLARAGPDPLAEELDRRVVEIDVAEVGAEGDGRARAVGDVQRHEADSLEGGCFGDESEEHADGESEEKPAGGRDEAQRHGATRRTRK